MANSFLQAFKKKSAPLGKLDREDRTDEEYEKIAPALANDAERIVGAFKKVKED